MNWRRLSLLLACLLGTVVPTGAATNQTNISAGNLTDAAYQDAVTTAATPASYQQATVLFKAIGAEIVFIVGCILVTLLFIAGIAGYWREDRFWAVYFLTFFVALLFLIGLPSLWISF